MERRRCRGGAVLLDGSPTRFDEDALTDAWAARLSGRGRPGSPDTVAVYVNVPYCGSRCRYCMYPSSVCEGPHRLEGYVAYLEERLRRVRRRLGRLRAGSIYVGGGTPSLLPVDGLERLFGALELTFAVAGDVTFEAHPGSLDEEKILRVTRHGVDRISLGVQSTEPRVLAAVGRENPPRQVLAELVRQAVRHAAFVNVDLMIGLPGQTASGVERDLRWALGLGARSVTLYRYQPVDRLPAAPDSLTYHDLSWSALVLRALAGGYVPVWDGGRDAFSASFFRPLPSRAPAPGALPGRLASLAHLIRSGGFRRPLPARARLLHFTGFDVGAIHVMGFGPGAISHLYGGAWYRDDTAPATLHGGSPPRLAGRTVRLQDELCGAVAGGFAEGRWVRHADHLASVGLGPEALLAALPAHLADALQWRRKDVRLRPSHAAAAEVIRWLLTRSATPEAR